MFVSTDVIGMIIALFAFAVAVLGGVGWMIAHQTQRMDRRFDTVDTRIDRIETRMDRFETRMDRIENELVDVKIAIARFEGPEKRLQRI